MSRSAVKPKEASDHDRIVGARVAALRKTKGLSRAQFAVSIVAVQQQAQKFEYGKNCISSTRLRRGAAALEVPVSIFFDEFNGGPSQLEEEAPDCLKTPDALDLLRAFIVIEDGQLRQEVLAIVRSIARAPRTLPV